MAVEKIQVLAFLDKANAFPVLDVRSPGEFLHASLPGAHSFPLFSNEERAVVGTLYKQESREKAIKAGLDFFGGKMRRMVEEAESILANHSAQHKPIPSAQKTILVHCWRGGMRSAAIAWLLDLYGFKVYTLVGGYKAFRRWAIETLNNAGPIAVLGGFTGSGKTDLLHLLKEKHDQPVVDLEGLANHKGSAFGAIDMPAQPSQEMFENKLAQAIYTIRQSTSGPDVKIWMEDESQRIGSVNLPQPFWQHFRQQHVYFMDIPFEERLSYLVHTYGKLNKGDIAAAITRIQKRLGGLETKTALNHLVEQDMRECFRILLSYYDKKYDKGLLQREDPETGITKIKLNRVDPEHNAKIITQFQQNISV